MVRITFTILPLLAALLTFTPITGHAENVLKSPTVLSQDSTEDIDTNDDTDQPADSSDDDDDTDQAMPPNEDSNGDSDTDD